MLENPSVVTKPQLKQQQLHSLETIKPVLEIIRQSIQIPTMKLTAVFTVLLATMAIASPIAEPEPEAAELSKRESSTFRY